MVRVIVEPIHTRVEQPDHILGAGGSRSVPVLLRVKLPGAQGGIAGGIAPFHRRVATARVLVAMPQRSIHLKSGSIATTTIEPGGSGLFRETNGWSIHPPAKAMR